METVGLIGLGKLGLPIAENLIKSGYRVIGYRRSSMRDFERVVLQDAAGPQRVTFRLPPKSERGLTSCSPACPRQKRSTRWCRARSASCGPLVPDRLSSSLALI